MNYPKRIEIKTKSPADTQKVAKNLAKTLHGGDVVALFGELGCGKTVFVKGLAVGLGVRAKITSPTFVLQKSYSIDKKKYLRFYHLDLYRLTQNKDIQSLGLEEIFSKDSIVVIEWADRLKHLPKKRIDVFLETIDGHARRIAIKRY